MTTYEKISGNSYRFNTQCFACRKPITFIKIMEKITHATYICAHCKQEITEIFDLDEYNLHVSKNMKKNKNLDWKMKMMKHIRSGKKW